MMTAATTARNECTNNPNLALMFPVQIFSLKIIPGTQSSINSAQQAGQLCKMPSKKNRKYQYGKQTRKDFNGKKMCLRICYQTDICVALSLSLFLFVVGIDPSHPPKTPRRSRTHVYKTWGIAAHLYKERKIQPSKYVKVVNFAVKTNHLAMGFEKCPAILTFPQRRSHWMCLFSSPSPTGWQLGRSGTALVESQDTHRILISIMA